MLPPPRGLAWFTSYLVGGFNPSEKYESQWEGLSHINIMENILICLYHLVI
jgi:hypothetical protein